MDVVGWVMESEDGMPVVIAATSRDEFMIRDTNFAHGRTWLIWHSNNIAREGEWVTQEYEIGNHILAVPPMEMTIYNAPMLLNPTDADMEDTVERIMSPLLDLLVLELGYRLPQLMTNYGRICSGYPIDEDAPPIPGHIIGEHMNWGRLVTPTFPL